MTERWRVLLLIAVLFPALAQAAESPQAVRRAAVQFVRAQTHGLPGVVTVAAQPPDPRLALSACAALAVSVPPGGRLWGRAAVTVACPGQWQIDVPVTVTVTAPVLVATHALTAGEALTAADVDAQTRDLTLMPPGVLTRLSQAAGQVLGRWVPAGGVLRGDMLRAPWAVRMGQAVHVHARGTGFDIDAEGQALGNAAAGQSVNVRLANGRMVRARVGADGTLSVAW